jgi:hypothetical protein
MQPLLPQSRSRSSCQVRSMLFGKGWLDAALTAHSKCLQSAVFQPGTCRSISSCWRWCCKQQCSSHAAAVPAVRVSTMLASADRPACVAQFGLVQHHTAQQSSVNEDSSPCKQRQHPFREWFLHACDAVFACLVTDCSCRCCELHGLCLTGQRSKAAPAAAAEKPKAAPRVAETSGADLDPRAVALPGEDSRPADLLSTSTPASAIITLARQHSASRGALRGSSLTVIWELWPCVLWFSIASPAMCFRVDEVPDSVSLQFKSFHASRIILHVHELKERKNRP